LAINLSKGDSFLVGVTGAVVVVVVVAVVVVDVVVVDSVVVDVSVLGDRAVVVLVAAAVVAVVRDKTGIFGLVKGLLGRTGRGEATVTGVAVAGCEGLSTESTGAFCCLRRGSINGSC